MAIRIFLQKNDLSKNPKIPYFTMKLIPEEEGADWIEIGAFWKAQSGKGYSGLLTEGVIIDATNAKKYEKKSDTD